MILNIITFALMLISACIIAALIIRKIPQLASIDILNITKERETQLKKQLMVERTIRQIRLWFTNLGVLKEGIAWITRQTKLLIEKIKNIERTLRVKKSHDVQGILHAARLVQESDPAESERLLLEVIRDDERNIEAYEGLSEIYMVKKEWVGVAEALIFLRKINPKRDQHYLFELVRALLAQGNAPRALRYADELITRYPSEPRFLDLFIEIAILVGDQHRAMQGIDMLRGVNPGNAKIDEFIKRLEEVK